MPLMIGKLSLGGAIIVAGLTGVPAIAAPATHTSQCAQAVTSDRDADEIRRLELRGARVNVEGWTLEEAHDFFASDWVSVQPNGTVMKLDGVWAGFKEGRSMPWAGRFDVTELEVRVYCDTAIAIGKADVYRIGDTGSDAKPAMHLRWLNVWRKVGNLWLYAANQFARF